jgi:hypothetical protein
MMRDMSRFPFARFSVLFVTLAGCSGCAKANSQESATTSNPQVAPLPPDKGGDKTVPADNGGGTNSTANRLQPEEGKLAVEAPADAKANTETAVKISLTAAAAYKVNTEFPIKLTLDKTDGVTIAKAELRAGGHDKAKGDADAFDEHELVFNVKLTPTTGGSHTIKGTFKFAICDKAQTTCLAKKEPIAIQVAAK